MTVNDVLGALVPFDEGLGVLFGVAVAVVLTTAVIGWFKRVNR